MILQVYIDDVTERRLRQISRETDRTMEDLAECAVAEAALDASRRENDR